MADIKEAAIASTIPDDELIRRILHGEKDLYAQIVHRYNQRLYRVAMSILYNDLEVEDIMQTAYINAYMHLDKFEHKASFSTWLTRILVNECILRLKRKQNYVAMNDLNSDVMMQDPNQTPMIKTMNAELKNILNEAIRQLPEIYRTVFVMREIEQMNIAETKECLGISEVNVKVRLNRAKAMLKDSLGAYYDKDEIMHFHLQRCARVTQGVMKNIGSDF